MSSRRIVVTIRNLPLAVYHRLWSFFSWFAMVWVDFASGARSADLKPAGFRCCQIELECLGSQLAGHICRRGIDLDHKNKFEGRLDDRNFPTNRRRISS
ncbi:hypothetical protein BH10CYA1_BH10CYA1_50080 [soil metagenome]